MEDIICCIQVKEYDRKRGRAQSALAEQNWAEAEQLFSDALHVSSVLYCIMGIRLQALAPPNS